MGHLLIGSPVADQALCHSDDVILHHAGQLYRSRGDRLRPLRLPAQDQDGLSQGGGLLLKPAGICQHQVAAGYQVVHLVGGQGFNQMNPGRAPEIPVHRLPDHRAEVHRIDQFHLRMLFGNLPQGQKDVSHRLTVVLPPVASDQKDLLLPIGQAVEFLRGKPVVLLNRGSQGVNHRIASDKEVLGVSLPAEIFPVAGGGTKVHIRDSGDQQAVHLLREGGVLIVCPQARLHMPHWNPVVKGGQRPRKGSGGIPVNQHHVRLQRLQRLIHTGEAFAGNRGQSLPGRHNIQVPIRPQIKDLQHGVQHLAVLGGDTAEALDPLPG